MNFDHQTATQISNEMRYYLTDETVSLPGGSRPALAREDGTRWVQDSDCQVLSLEGNFSEEKMAAYRKGKFLTHAELKRDYEAKFGPNSDWWR
jgi:hypothetical protein